MFLGSWLDHAININIYNPAPKQDFFAKILPVLSPLLVALTFTGNYIINRNIKRADSKRAWYLKAYFDYQIKKVDDFFSSSGELVKINSTTYISNQNTWSNTEKIEFVGTVLLSLADLKRKFEIEVLKMIQYTYPEVFTSIAESLLTYEDAGTDVFTNTIDTDAYFIYMNKIHNIKRDIITALSGPAIN